MIIWLKMINCQIKILLLKYFIKIFIIFIFYKNYYLNIAIVILNKWLIYFIKINKFSFKMILRKKLKMKSNLNRIKNKSWIVLFNQLDIFWNFLYIWMKFKKIKNQLMIIISIVKISKKKLLMNLKIIINKYLITLAY